MSDYIVRRRKNRADKVVGELVRCGECKYCVNGQCWKAEGLDKLDGNVADDDFCSRGERKESE